jgi:dihydrofolate reductase
VGKLIYTLNVSLDGFIETPDHGLDWTIIDDEIHSWFNEHERSLDASLYGRRLWEVMSAHWPTAGQDPSTNEVEREYARIWNSQPKIVFSTTLQRVEHHARLVRGDVGDVLRDVRREFDGDIGVAGPNLAGQFVRRGLVDEYRLMVHPVVLGAGTPFWPSLAEPIRLRLTEARTFQSGTQLLVYAAA